MIKTTLEFKANWYNVSVDFFNKLGFKLIENSIHNSLIKYPRKYQSTTTNINTTKVYNV